MFDGTKGWHCEDYDFDEVIDSALDIDFEYGGARIHDKFLLYSRKSIDNQYTGK